MPNYMLPTLVANPVAVEFIPPAGGPSSFVGCFEAQPYIVSLSAEGFDQYRIYLYAENSNSAPWQQPQNKWSHLIPQWRFTDLSGNYIESIVPTTTSLISGGTGYVGTAQFYYVDDRKAETTPVKLWATVDYNSFFAKKDKRLPLAPVSGFANSLVINNINHTVYGLLPTRIGITRNGKDDMFSFYWQNTEIPIFFTLNGPLSVVQTLSASQDPILFDYPVSGTDFVFNKSISGILFNSQTWSPSSYTQAFSATDTDDFSIGGYVYNTLSLSSENLSVIVTAGNIPLYPNVSGQSKAFDVLLYDDYFIRRFNESWDATRVMTDMIFAPHIKQNQTFWNGYVSGVFGGKETVQGKAFGRESYERIANFVPNHADVEVCGVDQLYSLANETDVPIDDYGFEYPPEIRRIMDIITINQQRLWGARCTCRENIKNEYRTYVSGGQLFPIYSFCEKCGFEHSGNRGALFDGLTYIVTAGVEFIVEDKYRNRNFSLITPPPSCNTQLLTGVDPCTGTLSIETCLTAYPLSASYWWLLPGVFTTTPSYDDFITAAIGRFCFYRYVEGTCNTQVAGVINWDDPYTTLEETLSTSNDWYGKNQAIDKILSYVIHKGLGLIDE